jgi:hypothetical protein
MHEIVVGCKGTSNPCSELDCDDRNEVGVLSSDPLEGEREEDEFQEGNIAENTLLAYCIRPKPHYETSNLFVDEDEINTRDVSEGIKTTELSAPSYSLSNVMSSSHTLNLSSIATTYEGNDDGVESPRTDTPSPSEIFTNLPSLTIQSNTKRFGLFSPSSWGELQDVEFGQIDADEELARHLQAEEDKKQTCNSKPRPAPSIFGLEPTPWEVKSQYTTTTRGGGATLECWFPDSWTRFGRHLSSTASSFFSDVHGKTQHNDQPNRNIV